MNNIKDMIGKTFVSVTNKDNSELIFESDCGTKFTFYHWQDCCESVEIEDINGNLDDLVGTPLLVADETSSTEVVTPGERWDGSMTWTFYKFATVKGWVDVRWLGMSNGYYSERVNLLVEVPGE